MSWSKVRGWPPIGWWYHKIMGEFWYAVGNYYKYYNHLNAMTKKYKTNLYGEKIR